MTDLLHPDRPRALTLDEILQRKAALDAKKPGIDLPDEITLNAEISTADFIYILHPRDTPPFAGTNSYLVWKHGYPNTDALHFASAAEIYHAVSQLFARQDYVNALIDATKLDRGQKESIEDAQLMQDDIERKLDELRSCMTEALLLTDTTISVLEDRTIVRHHQNASHKIDRFHGSILPMFATVYQRAMHQLKIPDFAFLQSLLGTKHSFHEVNARLQYLNNGTSISMYLSKTAIDTDQVIGFSRVNSQLQISNYPLDCLGTALAAKRYLS